VDIEFTVSLCTQDCQTA